MPSLVLCAFVIWHLAVFITPSLAQTSRLFQWEFSNDALSTSLPTCYPLPIIVESFNTTANDTIGTPPYYMMAFVVGGTPMTTLIGTDENNLNWTVTEPVGSQLMLSVVDANGSAGGTQPRMFTVIAGSNTECVTTPMLTPAFSVTANVTGDLQTCQPWGFTVKGGVPPYTITFTQLNSPVVMNFTMPVGDDSFTFINRADPNGQLVGAVSDITGRWAAGTPIVNTTGSSDLSCTGLLNSSGNATLVQQAADAANNALSAAKERHSVVVGVSVTFLLLFLMIMGIGTVIYFRRRQRRNQEYLSATLPRQFVEVEAQLPSLPSDPSLSTYQPAYITTSERGVTTPPQSRYHNRNPPPTDNSSTTGLPYYPSIQASDRQTTSPNPRSLPSTRVSHTGFTNFPSSSIRPPPKYDEASARSAVSPNSEYVLETAFSDSSDVLGRQLSIISSTRVGAIGRLFRTEGRLEEEPEMMDQHQDADIIREPPPPYADSSEFNRSTS